MLLIDISTHFRFASAMEDSFNLMFLVQMMASAMTLILQGYQLVMVI